MTVDCGENYDICRNYWSHITRNSSLYGCYKL